MLYGKLSFKKRNSQAFYFSEQKRLKAVFRNKIPAYETYKIFRCAAACRFQAQAKVPLQIQATLSRLPLLCFCRTLPANKHIHWNWHNSRRPDNFPALNRPLYDGKYIFSNRLAPTKTAYQHQCRIIVCIVSNE